MDFPATPAVAGTLSAADKQKINDLETAGAVLAMVWFHLLPQPASSGTPANAVETGAPYAVKARFLFDFTRLNIPNTVLSGKLYARGFVTFGNGDIQLFNVTDGVEMGVINYSELEATNKTSAPLTPIPTSGLKMIEVRLRKVAGAGPLTIETASADFVLSSP